VTASPRPTPPDAYETWLEWIIDRQTHTGEYGANAAARAELAALRQERNDALDGECVLAEQIEAEILTRAKAEKEIATLRARVADLETWIHDAIIRGRSAVDRANEEFGYESLRFADVRYGWHETIGDIADLPIEMPSANAALRKDVD
jgi:hypothetical protein